MKGKHFIPNGWKRVSLHELANVHTGIAKGKKNIKNPVERPYLRVANVQDGRLDLSEMKTIIVSVNDIDRYRLQSGDVLMTEGGDFDKLGRGYVWQNEIADCLHQNHVFAVRPNQNRLDPYFLTYQAGSSYGKKYFLNCSKQSTNLASINSTQLKEYPVLLPTINEQKSIVNIIKCWDRAISLTENLIFLAQNKRKGFMQQLLSGDKRFPEFIYDWKEVKLGVISKRISRRNTINNTNVLTISAQMGLVSQREYYKKNVASSDLSTYYLLNRGDFAYNKSYSAGYPYGAIKRLELYDAGVVSSLYVCFKVSNIEYDEDFFAHFFEAGMLNHGIYRIAQEGARNHGLLNISVSDFFEISLKIPSLDEQQKIANTLNIIDKEINFIKQELEALKEQKKGLMQKLLTGKLRVKVTAAA